MIDRRRVLGAAAVFAAARGDAVASEPITLSLRHGDGRDTDYRVLKPARSGAIGLLLFSHGAKSSNQDYDLFLRPWANAGFLVVAPNHPDANIKGPTPPGLFQPRLEDMRLVLDRRDVFAAIAASADCRLEGPASAAGHSFGGGIVQAMAGAKLSEAPAAADPRIACVVALSPPGPRALAAPSHSWSNVVLPAFLQTGTADAIPGFIDDWRQHKEGFEDEVGRSRWLAIGAGVNHLFGGLICYRADGPEARREAPALSVVVDLSSDFLKAYAKGDAEALSRLKVAAVQRTYEPVVAFTGF